MIEATPPPTLYDVRPGLYLLDTNILIIYVRRGLLHERIENKYKLQSRPEAPLISYVTEAEVRSFAVQNKWGAAKLAQLAFLLTTVKRIPIEEPEILNAYVRMDAFCSTTGHELGKNDAWIAATARVARATLLTTDGDFHYLNGRFLSVDRIDPTI